MINYQLYNTNVLLGGQQKWDIIIESDGNLYVKDFHISPISDNVSYDHLIDENLLNYSHQENLKSYYKKVQGEFYKICPNAEFNNMWPLFNEGKNYSDLYMAGVKRSKYFSLYGKQFEFLCPLWINSLNDKIEFIFELQGKSGTVLGAKSLILDNIGKKYHDKFVKYFYDYISYISLDDRTGNLYVDLDNKKASIYGLEINTGINKMNDCSYLVDNLLQRERPMMEVDHMICSLFKNHKMISTNLFNFNFMFNIDDIVSHIIEDELKGNIMNINVRVIIDGKELGKKSFYTNYECINRYSLNGTNYKNSNIFSYLNDYKYVDQIDKNKFDPQICHWSIDGNNEYIFNLYRGFGAVYLDKRVRKYVNNRYFNTPDLHREKYSIYYNNLNWCNHSLSFTQKDMESFEVEKMDDKDKTWESISSNFNLSWVNNIKYKDDDVGEDLYVYLGVCNKSDFIRIRLYNTLNITKNISCRYLNKKLLIVSDDINMLTFRGFKNQLKLVLFNKIKENIPENNEELKNTYDAFLRFVNKINNLIIYPSNIKLKSSITPILADGPEMSIREVSYIKNDNIKSLQRYGGFLTPTFIDLDHPLFYNYIYGKTYVGDKLYMLHNYDKYTPIYPSIGYYFISKDKPIHYYPEYKFMDENRVLIVEDRINTTISDVDDITKTIHNIIYEKNNMSNNEYLLSLYKYKYNEIADRKYNINIELK